MDLKVRMRDLLAIPCRHTERLFPFITIPGIETIDQSASNHNTNLNMASLKELQFDVLGKWNYVFLMSSSCFKLFLIYVLIFAFSTFRT